MRMHDPGPWTARPTPPLRRIGVVALLGLGLAACMCVVVARASSEEPAQSAERLSFEAAYEIVLDGSADLEARKAALLALVRRIESAGRRIRAISEDVDDQLADDAILARDVVRGGWSWAR